MLLVDDPKVRQRMVEVAQVLVSSGLNRGASGNLSVRNNQGFWVTPTAIKTEQLQAHMMVSMDSKGNEIDPNSVTKPSSEWRFHKDILNARPEVGAIIHTHSHYATTLACMNLEVPAFHYMIALAGGDNIRCAPYALFGGQELSDVAVQALDGRKACLLGNHGMIALGADLDSALSMTIEVESLCAQYWSVLQLGQPKLLSEQQMQAVLAQFEGYGR